MIRIYGYGTVGQATHFIFRDAKVQIVDPPKGYIIEKGLDDDVLPEVVFICTPIPNKNGQQDLSGVIEILDDLYHEFYKETSVCIRSTITAENFLTLQAHFEGFYKFSVMPEFLNENTSFNDVQENETLLLGGEFNDLKEVISCIENFTGKLYEIVSAEDACNFKYVHNLYGACKVLFWEMTHDITGGKSRQMYRLYEMFKSGDMATVGMDGFRGAGGKCFPENLETMQEKHPLLKCLHEYNQKLLYK